MVLLSRPGGGSGNGHRTSLLRLRAVGSRSLKTASVRFGRRANGSGAGRLCPLFPAGCRVTSGWASGRICVHSQEFRPVPAGRNSLLWDCKVTPADCACQGRNTIGCIPSNDGLGARFELRFPHGTDMVSTWRTCKLSKFSSKSLQLTFPASHQAEARRGWPNRLWRLAAGARDSCGIVLTLVLELGLRVSGWKGRDNSCNWQVEGKQVLFACEFIFRRRRSRNLGGHGDVNVFKNFSRRDADDSIGRFDEIVSSPSGVLASERIGEAQVRVELFRFDQEASSVGVPLFGFHGALTRVAFSADEMLCLPNLISAAGTESFCVGRRRMYERNVRRSIQYFWCN